MKQIGYIIGLDRKKGDIMEVSSSTNSGASQIDVLKKAIDTQSEQALKILEDTNKQTQETVSQADVARKTGVGSNLNING